MTMVFYKILSFAAVAYGVLVSAVTSEVDDVNIRLQQRRRDLQEQGPMSKKQADFMRTLISKRVLRVANKPGELKEQPATLITDNPFARALDNEQKQSSTLPNRAGGRRSQERGTLPSQIQRGLGGTERKGSKKGGSNKSGKGGNGDSKPSGPSVPQLVPMVLEAFQDARMVQPPILTGSTADELVAGTQYMFANEPLFNVKLDSPGSDVATGAEGYYVDEADMIATVSGTCTRTDPNVGNEMYVGRAYCEYSYHFLDEFGNVEAGLVAEGPIQIGDYSTLSIKGGTGIFRGTVGTIILESGSIDFEANPVFVPDPLLDLPSSYIVNMFVFMDSLSLTGNEDIYK